VRAFGASEGDVAVPVFGPSGVLREGIERGDYVDLFAAADMEHPRALEWTLGGLPVVMFMRTACVCWVAPISAWPRTTCSTSRWIPRFD